MKSIQGKILTTVISAILILAIAISLISMTYIKKVLDKDSDAITESVANTESMRINATLNEAEAVVRIMENYVSSTLTSAYSLNDADYLADYTARAKETFYAIVKDFSDATAFYLRFSPDITDNKAGFFISSISANRGFVELEPTDLSDYENAPYEKVCWFTVPKNCGVSVWLDPYHNPNNNINMVSYVTPIYKDNRFVGVVGIDVEFSSLTTLVDKISVYDNGFAYLAGDNDKIYYSSVDDHTFNRKDTDHGYAEEVRELDNGMKLVIHADYSDIQRDSYRMLMMIIFIVLLVMASFIFIAYLITRKIIRPLKQLTVAAEVIAEGTTELELDSCNTGDEVELLANSMKKTAEKLSGYMSYINALAYRDSLTGVKNNTAYKEMATGIDIRLRMKEMDAFAILVADINALKMANDKYGHEVGNKLIIKAAKIICDVFKHSPVFRIGGDEFVVIIQGEDYAVREELLKEMNEKCLSTSVSVGDTKLDISIAAGIAEFDSESDETLEDVFDRADKKMYANKEAYKSENGTLIV